jgi:hypothetical protein
MFATLRAIGLVEPRAQVGDCEFSEMHFQVCRRIGPRDLPLFS